MTSYNCRMEDEKDKTTISLTLFFTYGISLKSWVETGLLQREIHLYKHLKQQGIKVQFLTYGDVSDRQWESHLDGIGLLPVYERLRRPRSKLLALLQTVAIPFVFRVELRASDFFKTNQIWGGWVAVIAKYLCNKPLLTRCGYEFYKFALNKGEPKWYLWMAYIVSWFTYRQAQRVHVATCSDKHLVEQVFGVPARLIGVYPNWIDNELFAPREEEKTSRLLCVGRLTVQKHLELLLKALEGTELGLDLVGDGELRTKLEAEADQRGVDVRFLGRLQNDQLPAIYNAHRIYVLCSRYEGNPKTLLEAMACGCAVIGTDVPGIREVIKNGHSGLLVPEEPVAMHKAIQSLMASEELQSQLGQNARRQIVENNSLLSIVEQEINVYRNFLV